MSLAAHPSTSPLPSVKQALPTVAEDEDRRADPSHTQSIGLLSPISSFTSILSLSPPSTASTFPASSSSSFSVSSSSSSYHHAPFTPRTPPRSNTTPKPRPSPLVRLLQPFARSSPLSAPTSPTFATYITPMALHHPTPQAPSSATSTIPRPPSRSERLLRDALMRDEMERSPLPSSSVVQGSASAKLPSSTVKTHRRRHSHVPTSRLTSPRSDVSPDRDELTRGTFLFRNAMNNPRSPSPLPAAQTQPSADLLAYYGGDAEGSSSPTAPVRHQRHQQPQAQPDHRQSPQFQTNSRSPAVTSLRSTSHSPSPMRRPRPAELPLETDLIPSNSPLRRHNTTQARISDSPIKYSSSRPSGVLFQGPTSPGEPLVMTPHEQALRARLERALCAGRPAEKNEREKRTKHRQRSESRGNEVRDEEGGWPWRERAHEQSGSNGEGSKIVAGGSMVSSPLSSSTSNNSGSTSSRQQQPQSPPTIPQISSSSRTVSHNRNRSQTEPMSPLSNALGPGRLSAVPSPRRSSTTPVQASRIPMRKQSTAVRSPIPRTGTTPPLVGGEDVEADDGEADEGDMRLLTPPPTPPFTARMFSFAGPPAGADAYFPSPYKTAKTAPQLKGAFALGSPRRPRNAPVRRHQSSLSDPEHEQESSSDCSGHSQASFPASDTSSAYAHRQQMRARSVDVEDSSAGCCADEHDRPQFNARKASARCRAMEGYVSFASVEGLGEPPADPLSPDADDLERERGRSTSVFWGGWKKLLNVAGVVGHENHQVNSSGVVL